jgi:hypothetical protein
LKEHCLENEVEGGRGEREGITGKKNWYMIACFFNIKQAYSVFSSPGKYKHLRFIKRGVKKYSKNLEDTSKLLQPERRHEAGFYSEKPPYKDLSPQ